jgi:hypothetical protein
MAPLQKEVYRSILSKLSALFKELALTPEYTGHNLELLNGLTQPSNPKLKGAMPKGRINNVLMQLRKFVGSNIMQWFMLNSYLDAYNTRTFTLKISNLVDSHLKRPTIS